jgi:hypothetical protein
VYKLNKLEFIKDLFKEYSKIDDAPLNTLEVANLWTMLTATENFMSSEMVAHNTAQDEELREKIRDLSENYHKVIIHEIKDILLKENVELPPPPSDKPLAKLDVPAGARMTDREIANLIVFNLVWAIKFCARGLTESVRADVGTLFTKWIMLKATFALTLKTLIAEKGWIKVPPKFKG